MIVIEKLIGSNYLHLEFFQSAHYIVILLLKLLPVIFVLVKPTKISTDAKKIIFHFSKE